MHQISIYVPKKTTIWKNNSKIQVVKFRASTRALNRVVKYLLQFLCEQPSSLNIRFCDAEEMIQSNTYFRNKNAATDVLSFPSANPHQESLSHLHLGDILICLPTCIKQAAARKHSLQKECERMLIHGVLHLKGFDHERGEHHWKLMTTIEKQLAQYVTKSFTETWIEVVD